MIDNQFRRPTDDPRVAQTRELILKAAQRLILDEGQEAVTPTRLTDLTGISRSTIYRHFSDPSAIIFEAAAMESEQARFTASGDLRKDLTLYLEELRGMLNSPRGKLLATQMESAEHREEASESMQRVAVHRRELIRTMLEHDGDFSNLHALVVGPLIYQRYMARDEISDDLIALVVDRYLDSGDGAPD